MFEKGEVNCVDLVLSDNTLHKITEGTGETGDIIELLVANVKEAIESGLGVDKGRERGLSNATGDAEELKDDKTGNGGIPELRIKN
jgi:hypothetical protein